MAAGLAALLYVLFAASSKPETASGLRQYARGEMARLEFMDDPPPFPGRPVQNAARAESALGDHYSGDVVVLNLWATWCAPCVEEMPTLGGLARRFEGRNVDVVVVSFDSEAARSEAEAMLA
ncbi:MAG: TlpA family protein disulfide reductase, partial [Hyphomonadaceae bacterium]|nr:TlpA family protein disulfide reductase [Hyphomonadaceae bacterium]